MDYPKSVQGAGLVDGQFVDENPATGLVGSLIVSQWANAVTEEILNVLRDFDITPSETNVSQLMQAFNLVIRVDKNQNLNPTQIAQALKNLGAASVQSGNPTGTVIFYLGTDVPEGYLLCNGAAVSRTTYAKLFAVLGTRCGAGDGASTFNLPNFHGRVPQATTNVADVGKTLEASLPNITGYAQKGSPEDATDDHGIFEVSSGAFALTNKKSRKTFLKETQDFMLANGFDMDLSRGNSIYTGDKFQYPAIQALACIRC